MNRFNVKLLMFICAVVSALIFTLGHIFCSRPGDAEIYWADEASRLTATVTNGIESQKVALAELRNLDRSSDSFYQSSSVFKDRQAKIVANISEAESDNQTSKNYEQTRIVKWQKFSLAGYSFAGFAVFFFLLLLIFKSPHPGPKV